MESNDRMDFSRTFFRIIDKSGLTKNALAERIGLHRSYLTRVEAGERSLGAEDLGKTLVELSTEDATVLIQSFIEEKLTEIVDAHDRHRGTLPKLRLSWHIEAKRGSGKARP
jgi:transcriptional regulator with XRE-family HTH domain